jgi:hypothetical protein
VRRVCYSRHMAQDRLWIKCRICGEEVPIAGQYGGVWGVNAFCGKRLPDFFDAHSHESQVNAWNLGNRNFEVYYESDPTISGVIPAPGLALAPSPPTQ